MRNIDLLLPVCTPTRDQICNLGLCPDRELNWLATFLCMGQQLTEPQWLGLVIYILIVILV